MMIGLLKNMKIQFSKINLFQMEDLTRLIISHERLENIKNNNLELTNEEAHYINKVVRITGFKPASLR